MYKYILLIALILTSCTQTIPMQRSSFLQLKGWEKADYSGAFTAFTKSCKKFSTLPEDYDLEYPAGKVKDWLGLCSIKTSNPKAFFENNFTPFYVTDNVLFTGYYEPALNGSRTKHGKYTEALYKLPANPHIERKTIEKGVLKGNELVYVDDPIALFFLHVQGSGRILLDDGSVMRVGYHGSNGYPYTSIGKYLVDKGVFELKEVTADKIKNWLKTHPDKIHDVMNVNKSYVFFREITSDPIGGQGVPLTPEHSIAIDKSLIPYGMPMWIETTLPSKKPYRKLFIAQDTGGAIKGIFRADVFFGYGKRAEQLAGNMKQEGRYYVLIPN